MNFKQLAHGYAVTYYDTKSTQNSQIKWFATNKLMQQWMDESHNIVKIENLERY